jgi:hypothetical protein
MIEEHVETSIRPLFDNTLLEAISVNIGKYTLESTGGLICTLGIKYTRFRLIIWSQDLLLSVKELALVSSETTAGSHVITTSASRFGGCRSIHIDMGGLSAPYIAYKLRMQVERNARRGDFCIRYKDKAM